MESDILAFLFFLSILIINPPILVVHSYEDNNKKLKVSHLAVPSPFAIYDDFEDGIYSLEDGQISPNGNWQNIFNGYGNSGVKDDERGNNRVFFMYPATSVSPNETHANSVMLTKNFSNFVMSIDVKTIRQLRENTPPNSWEAASILFRLTDTFHYYWFVLKTTGIELGKKDCYTCVDPIEGQQFLVTASNPRLKIGSWSNWNVNMTGNHIIISVNGSEVINFIDQKMSPKLASGKIAMYTEDASVYFDNFYLKMS